MDNAQGLVPGDFLIFQLESGFALLRVVDVDQARGIWHVAAYADFFLDADAADEAASDQTHLKLARTHVALTDHAFESTQVAKLTHAALTEVELAGYEEWKRSETKEVHDRSIRLLLGLR